MGVPADVKAKIASDPFLLLAQNIFCATPHPQLSKEQIYAVHEFFHEVAAAGFRLYQKVEPDDVKDIIKEKLGAMLDPDAATFKVPVPD